MLKPTLFTVPQVRPKLLNEQECDISRHYSKSASPENQSFMQFWPTRIGLDRISARAVKSDRLGSIREKGGGHKKHHIQ